MKRESWEALFDLKTFSILKHRVERFEKQIKKKKGKTESVKRAEIGVLRKVDVQIYRSILFQYRLQISPRPEVERSNNVGYLNEWEEEANVKIGHPLYTLTHQSAPSAEVKSRFRLTICRFQEGNVPNTGRSHNSFYLEQKRPWKFMQFFSSPFCLLHLHRFRTENAQNALPL